jgi:hypothetical protein
LFLFFFLSLLSTMEILHVSMRVDHELSRASKKIALYACAEGLAPGATPAGGKGGSADGVEVGGIAATVLADGYTAAELAKKIPEDYRQQMGMKGGIFLLQSKVLAGNDLVDLVAGVRDHQGRSQAVRRPLLKPRHRPRQKLQVIVAVAEAEDLMTTMQQRHGLNI